MTIAMVVCGSICAPAARCELVVLGFTGQVVDRVYDYFGVLDGKITVGDVVEIICTYDSSMPDSRPAQPSLGEYLYSSGGSGILLTVGDFEFATDSSNPDFRVLLSDNHLGRKHDSISLMSYNNRPLDSGLSVGFMFLDLRDSTGQLLSTDSLSAMPSLLDRWALAGRFGVEGDRTKGVEFSFNGQVTSAWVVPEPSSILVIGAGALLVRLSPVGRRRRKTIV